MEILIFVLGVVAGYFIEKTIDFSTIRIRSFWEQRQWQKSEQIWEKYQSLSFGLEVVQTGWKEGVFSEEQVVVTVDDTYELPEDILQNIYKPYQLKWETSGQKNNQQYGVSEIDPHRISDEGATKSTSHQLRIKGHLFNYFDFLSTNRLYYLGTREDQEILMARIDNPHYLKPIADFPNLLSVGLSLFCENGNCLVLTRRTVLISSGGTWSGQSIFNAVGEGVTLRDVYGADYQGVARLSPWITAKRGLREEIGIEFHEKKMSLYLHSFVWDSRILDYKFFGYTVNTLSRSDVKRAWINAPDRHENYELLYYDCGNLNQTKKIVSELVLNRENWSSESILCTLLSLLHLRKISSEELEKTILGVKQK